MTRYVLDTDTLSLLQHGHPKVSREYGSRRPSDLAITVISVEEQLSGWYTLIRNARRPDDLCGCINGWLIPFVCKGRR